MWKGREDGKGIGEVGELEVFFVLFVLSAAALSFFLLPFLIFTFGNVSAFFSAVFVVFLLLCRGLVFMSLLVVLLSRIWN